MIDPSVIGFGQSRAEGANFLSARYCGITSSMTTQATVIPKKRKGPAPTGKGTPVMVRLQPADLELLDLWIAAHDGQATRPEAVRRIIRQVVMRMPK
jgi:hypothetical protein